MCGGEEERVRAMEEWEEGENAWIHRRVHTRAPHGGAT